jgi:hypothetical protein
MRTTIDIPDTKYRLLKIKAASEGTTVKALVMKGVEVLLSERSAPKRKQLKLPILRSTSPGSIDIDYERIYDLVGLP